MVCDVHITDPIFDIQYLSRVESKLYVFIGSVNENVDKILKKIENKIKLNNIELELMKKEYNRYIDRWINKVNKNKLIFIKEKIRLDDSIQIIRNKIFVYLSNIEKKIYLIPNNQQLWVKFKSGKYKILGYSFLNDVNKNPAIYQSKLIIDKNFYDTASNTKTKRFDLTIKNNILIGDIYNTYHLNTATIYISDAYVEYLYLTVTQKRKNIEQILNGYIYKHWPTYIFEFNYNDIKNDYKERKNSFNKEKYIYSLFKSLTIPDNIFSSCNIGHITLLINLDSKENIAEYNNNNTSYSSILTNTKFIDLYNIFIDIKDKIDYNIPFIKYIDPVLNNTISLVYKPIIDQKVIDSIKLKSWTGLKKKRNDIGNYVDILTNSTGGLVIKSLVGKYNVNRSIYCDIFIPSNNKIKNTKFILRCGFTAEDKASINTIINVIDSAKNIINNINKIKNDSISSQLYIKPPEIIKHNDNVSFGSNTRVAFININIKYNFNTEINFDDIYVFAKSFKNFISVNNIQEKETNEYVSSFNFKYKKVTNYVNISDVFVYINTLKNKKITDKNIIVLIQQKFDKSYKDARKFLDSYKNFHTNKEQFVDDTGTKIKITIDKSPPAPKWSGSILISGLTNLFQIKETYNFITSFLYLYVNRNINKFKTDLTFKKYILDNQYLIPELDEYSLDPNVSNTKLNNLKNKDDYDEENNDDLYDETGDDINGYNYGDFLENYTNIEPSTNKETNLIDNNIHVEKNIKYKRQFATNAEICSDIKLNCPDSEPVIEKDTCTDLCDDTKYLLRRLQRYDLRLFKFTIDSKKKKYTQYSRQCASSDGKHPVVLDYNPDNNPKIDPKSYSYAIEYSASTEYKNWYICPEAWCPFDQIPILKSKVTNIRKKQTSSGNHCTVGKCPYGDHEVFLRNSNNIYPGFIPPNKHPDNFCLPCCYAAKHNIPKSSKYSVFSKCTGQDLNITSTKNKHDEYILSRGFPIEYKRYAILPFDVAKLLGTICDAGYLENKECYLRKGVNQYNSNILFNCVMDICQEDNNGITSVDNFKKFIITKIDKTLFKGLGSGSIEYKFYNKNSKTTSLENYINYIKSDENHNHDFFWDLFQRPNILFENGINIIIFKDNSLLCPLYNFATEFYDKSKNTIILISSGIYYEPIYFLKNIKDKLLVQKTFDSNLPELNNIYDILTDKCLSKYDIDWSSVISNSNETSAENVDNLLKNKFNSVAITDTLLQNINNSKFKIKYQIVDYLNKVYMIQLQNNLLLPVYPSGILQKYKFDDLLNLELLDYKTTIKLYNYIKKYNINVYVKGKILDDNKKYIVAILLQNRRIIPLKKSNIINDNIPISDLNYYLDADKMLRDSLILDDTRHDIVQNMNFEDESLYRLRFELAKYFLKNSTVLINVKSIINDNSLDNITKRSLLNNKIFNIIKEITSISKNKTLQAYSKPNIRKVCKSNNENECKCDPHCFYDNNTCLLFLNRTNLISGKNNLITYSSIIVEELLRNSLKRNEILNNKISNIIDRKNVVIKKNIIYFNETDPEKLSEYINTLYSNKKDTFINNTKSFEELTTNQVGFDKHKYIKHMNNVNNDLLKLDYISLHWGKILGQSFKVFTDLNESIFSVIVKIFNKLSNNTITVYTIHDIKELLINYILNININILKNIKLLIIKYGLYNTNNIGGINFNTLNNNNDISLYIVYLYKILSRKIFQNITTFDELTNIIYSVNYTGCDLDIIFYSLILEINMIILDKRISKFSSGFKCFGNTLFNSNQYLLIYASYRRDENGYGILQKNGKYIFFKNDLPQQFIRIVLDNCLEVNKNKNKNKHNTNISINDTKKIIRKVVTKKHVKKNKIKVKVTKKLITKNKIKVTKKPVKKNKIKVKVTKKPVKKNKIKVKVKVTKKPVKKNKIKIKVRRNPVKNK